MTGGKSLCFIALFSSFYKKRLNYYKCATEAVILSYLIYECQRPVPFKMSIICFILAWRYAIMTR